MSSVKRNTRSQSKAGRRNTSSDVQRARGRGTFARHAYEHIKNALLEGRYGAGERLSIDEISGQLGVSRFPVMEALKQLEAEQLVIITPQVGCSVATPSAREISDHFRFMERAEGFIAELAADRASKADIDNLEFISSQIGLLLSSKMQPAQTDRLYRKLNREFHNCIHGMAASPELTANVAKLFDRNDFYIAITGGGQIFADSLAESHREHEKIVDAIAARDTAKSRAALEYHIKKIRSRVAARTGE
jgi:DNA-binding GntR family transcriptional regulator